MAQKFIRLNNGRLAEKEATVTSTGVAEAGEVVALDSAGKLDVSVLPVGVGPDVTILEATEDLGAGDYVNIFDNGGTPAVRLADNSNSREAHGFVKSAFLIGQDATVYFEGANDSLSGLTVGARYFLGTAGSATATPPQSPAQISQLLGIAISATAINTDIDDLVELA
jgi:hypothetical protein